MITVLFFDPLHTSIKDDQRLFVILLLHILMTVCVTGLLPSNMEFIKVCLICLLMVSFTAGQGEGTEGREGTEGLVSVLMDMVKTEVSNQMKIERKDMKEEILKELQGDRYEEIRKGS